ncbi:MAG: hypothetical protein ACK47M_10590, partial [Caldilinea sp.]
MGERRPTAAVVDDPQPAADAARSGRGGVDPARRPRGPGPVPLRLVRQVRVPVGEGTAVAALRLQRSRHRLG